MCKAGIPNSSGQAYIPATQCHSPILYIINVCHMHATIIIFTVLLGAAIGLYINKSSQPASILRAVDMLGV